jgi:hypothetical protein
MNPGTVRTKTAATTSHGRGRGATLATPATARMLSGSARPCSEWYGKVPTGSRYTSAAANGQTRSARSCQVGAGSR